MHAVQNLIVYALLVPGCAGFAAWKLMPARSRRVLAASMLRLPHWPRPIESTLRRAAQAGSGCGCDGCDHAPGKGAAGAVQAIKLHRRTQR